MQTRAILLIFLMCHAHAHTGQICGIDHSVPVEIGGGISGRIVLRCNHLRSIAAKQSVIVRGIKRAVAVEIAFAYQFSSAKKRLVADK